MKMLELLLIPVALWAAYTVFCYAAVAFMYAMVRVLGTPVDEGWPRNVSDRKGPRDSRAQTGIA